MSGTDFPSLLKFASDHTRGWARDQLLDLAAIGLAMQLWRNEGPIESAHIEGHIADAEMMRANAAVTRFLRGQLEEVGEEPSAEQLQAWGERTGDMLLRLHLPDGRTTKQAAGPFSRRLAMHVRRRLRTIMQIAKEHGWSPVLSLLATGEWAYSRWWLSRQWRVSGDTGRQGGPGRPLSADQPTMAGALPTSGPTSRRLPRRTAAVRPWRFRPTAGDVVVRRGSAQRGNYGYSGPGPGCAAQARSEICDTFVTLRPARGSRRGLPGAV